jgi:RNA polymerase sigma-70 factor, ECF subfamily
MDWSEGYLFRTALNLHRKRARRLRAGARAEASVPAPAANEAAVDHRLTVLAAVAELSRGQREALVLVEWLGFDTTEAGLILGIRPVSVRSRLMDARRNLRRRLGGIDG